MPDDGGGSDDTRRLQGDVDLGDNKPRDHALELIKLVIQRSAASRRPVEIVSTASRPFIHENRPYDVVMLSVPVAIVPGDEQLAALVTHEGAPVFSLNTAHFDHFTICVRDIEKGLKDVRRWIDYILEECHRLIPAPVEGGDTNGVKFVVINELGHPNFWIGPDSLTITRGAARRQLSALFARFHNKLQKIASDRNVVIIAGTMHDPESFYNWGPIFFPNRSTTTDHFKLTSAYKSGEVIKTPLDDKYPVYSVDKISFSVLICLDVFDLNIFFERFQYNRAAMTQRPQIVFVPSYHTQDRSRGSAHYLREACRQLSLVTDVAVVYCGHGFDEDRHAVFVAGKEVALRRDKCAATASLNADELQPWREEARPVWQQIELLLGTSGRSKYKQG